MGKINKYGICIDEMKHHRHLNLIIFIAGMKQHHRSFRSARAQPPYIMEICKSSIYIIARSANWRITHMP